MLCGLGAAETMSESRRIDEITVGTRFRRNFAGVEALAASIAALGLLQPPGITPAGRLLWANAACEPVARSAGRRSRSSCAMWTPATSWPSRRPKTCARKDFTLSEAVAIKRALQPNLPKFGRSSPARETIAGCTGFSHETLRKAEAIVEAAEREPQQFEKLLAEMDRTGRVNSSFKQLKVARARDAHQGRRQTADECVADIDALAASGSRAGVILADPPWPFETWGDRGKIWSSVDNHFDPMTLDAIKALPVAALAAEDCALFLWCTWPLLVIGHPLDVIRAWGFEAKTLGFDWINTNPSGEGFHWGAGHYTRSNSEPCLLATRGSPQRMARDVHQIIMAPVGEHSAKPDEVHDRIERLLNGPYCELFARRQRPGWTCWGDEVPKAEAAE